MYFKYKNIDETLCVDSESVIRNMIALRNLEITFKNRFESRYGQNFRKGACFSLVNVSSRDDVLPPTQNARKFTLLGQKRVFAVRKGKIDPKIVMYRKRYTI